MSFLRPIQWYHSHADPIWPDGTFKNPTFRGQATHCWRPRWWRVPGTRAGPLLSSPAVWRPLVLRFPFLRPPPTSSISLMPRTTWRSSQVKKSSLVLCVWNLCRQLWMSAQGFWLKVFFKIEIGIFVVLRRVFWLPIDALAKKNAFFAIGTKSKVFYFFV
jgi:hypothetical protein